MDYKVVSLLIHLQLLLLKRDIYIYIYIYREREREREREKERENRKFWVMNRGELTQCKTILYMQKEIQKHINKT
jgi:hypothetical protein